MDKQQLQDILSGAKSGSLMKCSLKQVVFHYINLGELVRDTCRLNHEFDAVSDSQNMTLNVSLH